MHRFGPNIEPVLTAAAIIGREFRFPVLRTVTNLPDGELIETTYGFHPDHLRPHVESLAFHYHLSDRPDQALPYLIQAGQKAIAVYALEMTINYFEQALKLMDELALVKPEQRWHILPQLTRCHYILADARQTVGYVEQALALSASENWQPAPKERIQLYLQAAFVLITTGDLNAAQPYLEMAQTEVAAAVEESVENADLLYYGCGGAD